MINEKVIPGQDMSKEFAEQSSDAAGFKQLGFHVGCAVAAACVVHYSFVAGSITGVVVGEMLLGFVASFYFMGFHEMIHNTAFKTKWINKALAQVVGVSVFRGANWFWCFHWLHHRYTQDPERDPELSGGSSDLMDPSQSVLMYLRFMTGWPFGFERTFGMLKMAFGFRTDPWVIEAGLETKVRVEAAMYVLIYAACIVGAVINPQVRDFIIWYWLLPHMLGAGHLRFYQFAEHRACESGVYTDLDAWGAARTTKTWWLYRRLAWNMPYHIEHHAWPTVPFHLLPEVHERIKDNQPDNRCLISGKNGYLGIHAEFLRRLSHDEATGLPQVPHTETPVAAQVVSAAAKNRLADPLAIQKLPRYTMAEVAKHNTSSDCWVAIHGIVIDATNFLADHPGGISVLVGKAGQDASKMFKMIHPEGTLEQNLPDDCIIGILAELAAGTLAEPLLPADYGGA